MKEITADQVKAIMDKIPKTGEGTRVFLPMMFFKKLTDDEFKVLFYAPGFEMMISEKSAEYIVHRAKELGLKKGKHTTFKKEKL